MEIGPTEPQRAAHQPWVAVLTIVAVIFGTLGAWGCYWGRPEAKKSPEVLQKDPAKSEEAPPEPKSNAVDTAKASRIEDFLVFGVWGVAIAVTCGLIAGWVEVTASNRPWLQSDLRTMLMWIGGTIGPLTALLGLALAVRWRQSLFALIYEGSRKDARWVLIAASVFVFGLIVMFLLIQPAKKDERSNPTVRRFYYGFNSVFMGLLLLLVLVVANAMAFIKIPNTLVTNEFAFTELQPQSKTFLASVERPVLAYMIIPENTGEVDQNSRRSHHPQLYADVRGFLSQCEDYCKTFKPKYLSPALDTGAIASLLDRYKIATEGSETPYGVLLALGESAADPHIFIPSSDLFEKIQVSQEGDLITVFQAENKILTELRYMMDERSKEKIYLTQDHGEARMEQEQDGGGSVHGLIQYLRDKKLNVEPLKLDKDKPAIPDDAAVVMILGPKATIAADSPTMKALREYMAPTKPDARKGRLFAAVPAQKQGQAINPSGLEALFAEYGIQISAERRVVSQPTILPTPQGQRLQIDGSLVMAGPVRGLPEGLRAAWMNTPLIFSENSRIVEPVRDVRGFQVLPMLATPDRQILTWMENDFRQSAMMAFRQLEQDRTAELAQRKELSNRSRVIAAVSVETAPGSGDKETTTPRMIVLGGDSFLRDQGAVYPAEAYYENVASSLDWLAERRSSMGIKPRKTSSYLINTVPEGTDRLFVLLTAVVAIGGLGVGVWFSRRRV